MSIHVNADNFARAETDRMFADIQREAGGVNTFRHNRTPAPIDAQTVIRLNRDTLYSFAIVDLAAGAKVVVPDAGERYLSVMIVDHDHYVRGVLHGAGEYEVTDYAPDSDYVLVAVRTLVDPDDADDLSAVAAVQDDIRLEAGSAVPFESPEYDTASLDATRNALLALAAGLRSFERTFGSRDEVDPVRHLIGTAAGWGGLPVSEASYVGVDPQLPVGFYDLTMHDVPVDAFWSVSVYNAAGYFEPNEENRYTINSVTGARDEDGSVTVRFTPPGWATEPNSIPLPEGWNYLIRLYRPRPEFAEGSWRVPDLVRRRDREAEYAAAQPEAAEPGDTESDAAAPPATDNPGEGSAEGQADAPADEAAETPVEELTEVPEDELSEDELSEVGLETVAIEAVEDGSGAEAGASPEGLGDEQRSDERSGDPDAEASAR
jgi:hypothetical protein